MHTVDMDTIVRERMRCQEMVKHPKQRSMPSVCERAWWIKHDFSLNARLSYPLNHPLWRLKREIFEIYFMKTKIFVSAKTLLFFYRFRADLGVIDQEEELKEIFEGRDFLTDSELKGLLGNKRVSAFVLPYMKSGGLVIRYNYRRKEYWRTEQLCKNIIETKRIFLPEESNELYKLVISTLLQSYPYLSISQFEKLTGLSKFIFGRPLFEMVTEGIIEKVVMKSPQRTELFCIHANNENIPIKNVVVLDSRDPMVVLLSDNLQLPKNKFYVFIAGEIQAGFDLRKKGDNGYYVINFNKLPSSKLTQDTILENLSIWAEEQRNTLHFDHRETPMGKVAVRLVEILLKRGYQFLDSALYLDKREQQKLGIKNDFSSFFEKNPEFQMDITTPSALTSIHPQVESLDSFLLRSKTPYPDFSNLYHIIGLGGRLGVVNEENLLLIYTADYKESQQSLVQSKVLSYIKKNPFTSTEDVIKEVNNLNSKKVEQAILSLERNRKIIRSTVDFDQVSIGWEEFPFYDKPTEEQRQKAKDQLVEKLLKYSPPLTSLQIARYVGWTSDEVSTILNRLVTKKKLEEGYFLKLDTDIQFTVPEFFERESISLEKVKGIYLFPASEPIALVLSSFISSTPSIQPREAFGINAKVFMVVVDGQLSGYIVKRENDRTFSDGNSTNYDVDLYLTSKEIIGDVLERVNDYFLGMRRQKGFVRLFCGNPLHSEEYQKYHFTMELLGFKF